MDEHLLAIKTTLYGILLFAFNFFSALILTFRCEEHKMKKVWLKMKKILVKKVNSESNSQHHHHCPSWTSNKTETLPLSVNFFSWKLFVNNTFMLLTDARLGLDTNNTTESNHCMFLFAYMLILVLQHSYPDWRFKKLQVKTIVYKCLCLLFRKYVPKVINSCYDTNSFPHRSCRLKKTIQRKNILTVLMIEPEISLPTAI